MQQIDKHYITNYYTRIKLILNNIFINLKMFFVMKKIISSLAITAIFGIGIFVGFHTLISEERNLSEIELANIEALTDPEGSIRPCDNYNGYRRILPGNEKIYDCCYQERTGKGKDDCRRW